VPRYRIDADIVYNDVHDNFLSEVTLFEEASSRKQARIQTIKRIMDKSEEIENDVISVNIKTVQKEA